MKKELILGPPGTGKTTNLISKVAYLLDQGVPPERIAYVSFTRKASQEAMERAREKFSLPRSSFPYFRTLHSLAYHELGLSQSDVMQYNNWKELEEITGRNMAPDNFTDGVTPDQLIAFQLHLAKAKCRSYYEHFITETASLDLRGQKFGGRHRGGSLKDFVLLGDTVDAYKSNAALVDFSDMLQLGCQCAPLDVDYAIIDEAQDLSPLQWRFCKQMFKNCDTVWIGGDDDQAIYSWAGADLTTFLNMEANRTVLGHSWRLPSSIWTAAETIVQTITDRYEKEWEPRDGDAGLYAYVEGLSSCPLDNGETWYLLTRTKSQQQGIIHWLRLHGYTYIKNGTNSVKAEHLGLARSWTRLLKGESATFSQVRSLYENMRDDQLAPNAIDLLKSCEPSDRVHLKRLVADYGLKVERGVWHEVLLIDATDSRYYRAVKDRLGVPALVGNPLITVSTMHGVKGGEADNVYFSTSMGQRPHRHFKNGLTRDDESRIFYVAATRAKKNLYIKNSLQCAYPMPEAA